MVIFHCVILSYFIIVNKSINQKSKNNIKIKNIGIYRRIYMWYVQIRSKYC